MKTLLQDIAKLTLAGSMFALSAGFVQAQDAHVYQNDPMVKNLMAPTYRAPVPAAVPHELTRKQVRRLAATLETAGDHLKLARYHRAEADRLDAEAAGYEEAAAALRHGPMVKNLMAPGTPARYEFFASGFRKEAKSDRALALSQEEMAKNAIAAEEDRAAALEVKSGARFY